MYKLVFTEEADQELERESIYSESRWGKVHAGKYIRNLMKKMKILEKTPYMHRTHDDVLPGLRLMTYKGNQVLYWVSAVAKKVVILGVPSIHRELSSEELRKRAVPHGYGG
jgi:plasmid stabilization system protein ParE